MGWIEKIFGKRKEPREEIAWFDGEDAGMLQVIKEAQLAFHEIEEEIWKDSQRIVPAIEECLLKHAVPATMKNVSVEHLFVSDLYFDGESLMGVVASEPMYTDQLKAGMEIAIDPNQVTDWLYVIGGKSKGGFTFKYMWQNLTDDEKKTGIETNLRFPGLNLLDQSLNTRFAN